MVVVAFTSILCNMDRIFRTRAPRPPYAAALRKPQRRETTLIPSQLETPHELSDHLAA